MQDEYVLRILANRMNSAPESVRGEDTGFSEQLDCTLYKVPR
jgi:hypothetical protein